MFMVVLALFAVLCTAAFVLSFHKLKAFALQAGTPAELSWLLPVLIDGCVVVALVGQFRAMVCSAAIVWPFRALNLSCAGISVVLNCWYAASNLDKEVMLAQAVVVSALAPALLWALSEIVFIMAVSGAASDMAMEERVAGDPVASAVAAFTEEVTESQRFVLALPDRTLAVAALLETGATQVAAAERLKISRATVRREYKKYQEFVETLEA